MTAWFFLAFLCFWTWAIAAVTWRLLKTGRIEILGDKLAIQRSKHPLLFWLLYSGFVSLADYFVFLLVC
jgi:hypothetical protein